MKELDIPYKLVLYPLYGLNPGLKWSHLENIIIITILIIYLIALTILKINKDNTDCLRDDDDNDDDDGDLNVADNWVKIPTQSRV